MQPYIVTYRTKDGDIWPYPFRCMADDADHAREQMENAEPGTVIVAVKQAWDGPVLAAHTAIDNFIRAVRPLMDMVESEHGCEAAHGMPVEDPEHPWHESILGMRAALDALDDPETRPTPYEVDAARDLADNLNAALGRVVDVDPCRQAFVSRGDEGIYVSAWVWVPYKVED